jgi:hypothetical protein
MGVPVSTARTTHVAPSSVTSRRYLVTQVNCLSKQDAYTCMHIFYKFVLPVVPYLYSCAFFAA